jgi:hypothetical protein
MVMKENQDWPRAITIRATLEKTKSYLDQDYDEEHEGDDALLVEQGYTMETREIQSWGDIPRGYEPADEDDRSEYYEYLESKGKGEPAGPE